VNVDPFIEAEKAQQRSVKRACELLEVSRAAFYARLAGPSRRDRADAVLAAEIRAVHRESRGRYGAPRVHAELRRKGHRHGRKRIARLMRQAGLAGQAARRWKKTTIADPAAAAPPAWRNQRVPTAGDTPASQPASSELAPRLIAAQNRTRSSRQATVGRPGEGICPRYS
jgi:transposase InsO family protein